MKLNMKNTEVARNVRVRLNSNFKVSSLADEHILNEPVIFIAENHTYNDSIGEYVFIKGGSMTNSTTAYLTKLNLEFPIGENPLYDWKNMSRLDFLLAEKERIEKEILEIDNMALINYELKKLEEDAN